MADNKVGAPALDTNIESGQFDEKSRQQAPAENAPKKVSAVDDDDEDEDIDALIEDLESQDGHDAFEEEEEEGSPGGGRVVPEEMLQTDSRVGLTESEVIARRRKYGLNQMKEEKENLILKFLSYFIGPIQFVMEVSLDPRVCALFSAVLPIYYFHVFYRINFFFFPAASLSYIASCKWSCQVLHSISVIFAQSIVKWLRRRRSRRLPFLIPVMYSPGHRRQMQIRLPILGSTLAATQERPHGHCFLPSLHSFRAPFFPAGLRLRKLRAPHKLWWTASNWLLTLAGSSWTRSGARVRWAT